MRLSRERVGGVATATLVVAVMTLSLGADAKPSVRPSGGKAVAHRGGKVVPGASVPVAKTFSVNHHAGEPTIEIDPGGDIFYAANTWTETPGVSVGGATEILRSTDGGETWNPVAPRVLGENVHRISLDPYVYIDDLDGDNARVFTIDLTVACSYMSFSDDDGESWITNPLACGRPVNDHQTLFSGPPAQSTPINYPNLLYYCWNDIGSSSCSKSLDGGITFHPTGTPAFIGPNQEEEDNCGGIHGHGHVTSNGTVYLPREYCNKPMVAISEDEGLTWTQVLVSKMRANGSSDTSVTSDKRGNLYYLFVGQKDRLPYLSVSRNKGKTWSEPVAAGPPDLTEANLPSIDARGVGKIALVYYGSRNSPYARCHDKCKSADYLKTTWNGYLGISENALEKEPLFYTGLVNDPKEPLVRQRCGPGRCYNVLDFIDVSIGPDGIAHGAFVDVCIAGPSAQEPGCTKTTPQNQFGPGPEWSWEGLTTKLVGGPRLN